MSAVSKKGRSEEATKLKGRNGPEASLIGRIHRANAKAELYKARAKSEAIQSRRGFWGSLRARIAL